MQILCINCGREIIPHHKNSFFEKTSKRLKSEKVLNIAVESKGVEDGVADNCPKSKNVGIIIGFLFN